MLVMKIGGSEILDIEKDRGTSNDQQTAIEQHDAEPFAEEVLNMPNRLAHDMPDVPVTNFKGDRTARQ